MISHCSPPPRSTSSVRSSSSALSSTIRISLFLDTISPPIDVNCEIKRCALPGGAFGPDTASMTSDDALHCREANTCACEFVGPVQTLKRNEQLGGMSHIEARAVVADVVSNFAVPHEAAEFEARRRSIPGEFPCVPEQIVQRDTQQPRISLDHEIRLDFDLDMARRLARLELLCDRLDQVAQIKGASLQLAPRDARQAQQIVDELAHTHRGCAHSPDQVRSALVERAHGVIPGQNLGETLDTAQRRAQIVRDGIAKGLEFAIRFLEFPGAALDLLLQVLVELEDIGRVAPLLMRSEERRVG